MTPQKQTTPARVQPKKMFTGECRALPHRRLSKETCQRYGYKVSKANGKIVEIANYVRDGKTVGQKVRVREEKRFYTIGEMSDAPLFGQHLFKTGGKRLVITEGEIDAMTIAEMDGCKWPVVSIPNGAEGAKEAIQRNHEFVNSFEQVVFAFDSDEPGKKAAIECALVLTPGRAHIAHLPLKDASEMWIARKVNELKTALWQAEVYRPDGIVHISEVAPHEQSQKKVYDYPWDGATRHLWGRRSGEIGLHTSGSGMGKSTVLREMMMYDLLSAGHRVGAIMLEEPTEDTVNSLIGLYLNKPVKKIFASRSINARRRAEGKSLLDFNVLDDLTEEEYAETRAMFDSKPLYLYDHHGSVECETLMQKMEYLASGLQCEIIYLDHISIVISGLETGNERKDLDVLMTQLATFTERSGVRVEVVSHLKRTDGKPYNEGGQISLTDLRGSASLEQLSHLVLAYERDQQNPDRDIANTINVRSLKDRFAGHTGLVLPLRFSGETGRLTEMVYAQDSEGNCVAVPSDGAADALFDDED